ncbi:hypothetical protein [Natrinema sp. DC36]|uniref:hypothetical protein n=1 Tax=Natrinema sp. DC36 TaxID=2878680 RepID=UPI001CF07722|nr:hypothetical protein [Natrinema sp. DC36]
MSDENAHYSGDTEHENPFEGRGSDEELPPIIGYTIGPDDDAVTVCADCADHQDANSDQWGKIRDGPHYGDRVPYPECYVCNEVMRPETIRSLNTATDRAVSQSENSTRSEGGDSS